MITKSPKRPKLTPRAAEAAARTAAYQASKAEREQEQAIAVALLSYPEFLDKAGLAPSDAHTLDVIASVMGLTREGVRQIEARALRKIRKVTKPEKLKELMLTLNQPDAPMACPTYRKPNFD